MMLYRSASTGFPFSRSGSEVAADRRRTRSLPTPCLPSAHPRSGRVRKTDQPLQGNRGRKALMSASRERERGSSVPELGNPAFGTNFPCHLSPQPDHFLAMGQVCAWCQDEIGPKGKSPSLGRTSHGICRSCLDARIAALAPTQLRGEPSRSQGLRAPRRVLEALPLALA
jgi:hypothetical protein